MKNLGKKAQDKITGFTGIITAKCNYLYGCSQYSLTPEVDKDGKRKENEWFDEGRIKILGKGVKAKEVQAEENGCEIRENPKQDRF